jgi:flagellar hook-length control protein FliK
MNTQTVQIASLLESQAGLKKGRAKKGEQQGSPEQGFLRFLDKALGRGKKEGLPWTEEITKGTAAGEGWLALFKKGLFSSGVALKDMSLSGKALEGLKKLLLADGFSEEDVKGLLNGFFKNNANKEINIQQLLHKIGELKGKSKENSPDIVLEASALPYLDTLLQSFGLDVQQVEGIISQARVDGRHLSLKALAQNLKAIVSELQISIRTDMGELSVEAAKEMLTRMGMSEEAGKLNGPVSLEQFVRLVEEKVANLVPYRFSDGQLKQQVASLLESVSVTLQEKNEKTVSAIRQGVELEGFPFQSSEAGNSGKQRKKGIYEEWRKSASQGKKAAGDNKTGAETKGQIDIDGLDIRKAAQLGGNGNEMSPKMERLIEAAIQKSSQGTADTNKLTVSQGAHDNALGSTSVGESVAKSDVRSIPQYVVHQVGRRLGMAVKRGENHVRLQLKPPHLGSIQLDLAMKGNGVRIAMVAENQYVKDIMVSHVNELREALVEQGVELQKIDVEINQNFGHSMANAEKESHRARMWASSVASAQGEPEDEVIAPHTMARHLGSDGRLDMFA